MPFIAAAIPIITAVTAVAGVGLSAYGAITQAQAAKSSANAQQQIAADQQRQEALRQQQMELDARRRSLEAVRQAQRARATALAAANNQGAIFGSGLQGGYGQISGQTGVNELGINQSLELGRSNFALSSDISAQRYNIAGAQAGAAAGAGFASLGQGLVQSLGPINNLFGGSSYNGGSSRISYNTYGGVTYPIYN